MDDLYSKQEADKKAIETLSEQVKEYLKDLKKKRDRSAKGKTYLELRSNSIELFKQKNFGYNLLLDRAMSRKSIPDNATTEKISNGILGLRKRIGFSIRDDFIKTYGFRSKKSRKSILRDKSGPFYYGIVQLRASDKSFDSSIEELSSYLGGSFNPRELSFDEFSRIVQENISKVAYVPDLDSDFCGTSCSCNSYYYYFSEQNYSNKCTPSFSNPPKFSGIRGSGISGVVRNEGNLPGVCKHIMSFVEGYLLPEREAKSRRVYALETNYNDEKTFLEKLAEEIRRKKRLGYTHVKKNTNYNQLLKNYSTSRDKDLKKSIYSKVLDKYQRLLRAGQSQKARVLSNMVYKNLKPEDPLVLKLKSFSASRKLVKNKVYKRKRKQPTGIEIISKAKKKKSL